MKRLVMVLLLLAACQVQPVTQPGDLPDVHTGTQGLVAQFHESSTREITMCGEASVLVDLRNAGAYEITRGQYTFLLDESATVPLNEKVGEFSLEGRSEYNTYGGVAQIPLRLQNLGIPTQFESYDTPVVFMACYEYKTFASAPICIDPDVQGANRDKPCQVQPVMLSGGQGAPLAVSRVVPKMALSGGEVRPVFEIYLSHAGAGRVIHPSGVDIACGARREGYAPTDAGFGSLRTWEAYQQEGDPYRKYLSSEVFVSANIQDTRLNCGRDTVTLEKSGETRVVCESSLTYPASGGAFSSILSVEVEYGYVNEVGMPLKITRLPSQGTC